MIKQIASATAGFILVVIGYFIMVPVWNGLSNGIVGGAQNVVSNASYLNNIENYAYYLNLLFGLFFIGMGIGIWAYLLLQAWRAEAVSYSLPGEEVE